MGLDAGVLLAVELGYYLQVPLPCPRAMVGDLPAQGHVGMAMVGHSQKQSCCTYTWHQRLHDAQHHIATSGWVLIQTCMCVVLAAIIAIGVNPSDEVLGPLLGPWPLLACPGPGPPPALVLASAQCPVPGALQLTNPTAPAALQVVAMVTSFKDVLEVLQLQFAPTTATFLLHPWVWVPATGDGGFPACLLC